MQLDGKRDNVQYCNIAVFTARQTLRITEGGNLSIRSKERDLTEGSLLKYIFVLGIPVMAGMFMNNVYTLADLYWVGRLGPTEIAGVTLCQLLFFVVFSISQIFGMGTLALVARYFGQGRRDKAVETTRNAVFAALIVGLVLSATVFVFADEVVSLVGARGDVAPVALAYLKPFCLGFVFQLVAFTVNFTMRCAGDMITPMVMMGISIVLNTILDPFMIFGWGPFPEWGVAGAAIATTISQFIGAALSIFATVSGLTTLHVPVTFKFKPDWKEIWAIIRIGAPIGVQFLILSMTFFILIRIVAGYGEHVVATLGIAWRILHTASMPVLGIGAAVATLVGQNLGAKKEDRAVRATTLGVIASVSLASIFVITYFSVPGFFVSLFTDSKKVLDLAPLAIRIMGFSQIFIAVNIVLQSCFSGSGDTFPPMLAAIIRAVVMLVAVFFLPRLAGLGLTGIILGLPISTFTGMTVLYFFYRKGRWKTHMEKKEPPMTALHPVS